MIKELFLPTEKNNYTPHLLGNKFLAGVVVVLSFVNFLTPGIFPSLVSKTYASSISADDLIALANSDRVKNGLGSLTKNSKLTAAAKAKAEDMLAKDYWSHYGPNGETPWQFIKGAGYVYTYAGENLAKGFITSSATHDAWMNSPTHRANILKPEFKDIGIYVVDGTLQGEATTLVVQMFGSLSSSSNTSNPTSSSKASSVSSSKATVTKTVPTTITSPATGLVTNQPVLEIKGNTTNGSTVNLNINGSVVNTLNTTSETYSFTTTTIPEGENTIYVESVRNGISTKSDSIKITLDTELPKIDKDSFTIVEKVDGKYKFGINISDNLKLTSTKYKINEIESDLTKNRYGYILKGESVEFSAIDEAGNKAVDSLHTEIVSSVLSAYDGTNTTVSEANFPEKIALSLQGLTQDNPKDLFNLAIGLFILIVLLVDGIAIYRLKLGHHERAKSALHIPHLAVVLLLVIFSKIGSII
jgi:uncharacterized protein YkwD